MEAAGGTSHRRLVVTGCGAGGGGFGAAGAGVVGRTVVGATVGFGERVAERDGDGDGETVVGATDDGVADGCAEGDPDAPQPLAASASATRTARDRTQRR